MNCHQHATQDEKPHALQFSVNMPSHTGAAGKFLGLTDFWPVRQTLAPCMAEQRGRRNACLVKVLFRSITFVSPHTQRRRCDLDCVHRWHRPTHRRRMTKNFCLGRVGVCKACSRKQPGQVGVRLCPRPKTMRCLFGVGEYPIGHNRSSRRDGHVWFRSVETRTEEPHPGADHLETSYPSHIIRMRICTVYSYLHLDALDSCLMSGVAKPTGRGLLDRRKL
jgi:hypothetical protein